MFKRAPISPDPVGPGQESVWDYPRPPRVEASTRRLRVVVAGQLIAESSAGKRLLETSHPPTWYIPPADVRMELLRPGGRRSHCEFKGTAHYYDLVIGERHIPEIAWAYAAPRPGYELLRDHLCFYASRVDEAWVDDERVTPQAGGFYGGWITRDVVGPFKGEPGTMGW